MAATLIGRVRAAGSANTINCYIDRDIDAVMQRTSRRPLVAKGGSGAAIKGHAGRAQALRRVVKRERKVWSASQATQSRRCLRDIARDYCRIRLRPKSGTVSFGPYTIEIDSAERAAGELCNADLPGSISLAVAAPKMATAAPSPARTRRRPLIREGLRARLAAVRSCPAVTWR
jgi:hypothetical protein